MKKLTALFLSALMAISGLTIALAGGAAPEWTAYDELIAEIKSTTDFTKRVELMHQAEDMLMDTAALLPIYYYNDTYMMKEGIEGFYSNVYGNKFFQYTTYKDNSSLRINLSSEPDKLDPALNSSVDGACLAIASFGGLYTYDKDGKPAPNYAVDYEVSDDGLVYKFKMRDGLKWSDGSELNAKDFEYSWKRAASTETAADYSYMFSGIKGYPDELAVSASKDGKVFTVELAAPCAYMLDLCAFPTFFAVPQADVEGADGFKDDKGEILNPGAWAVEAGFTTSGAYKLESWKHNESMVYVKNENYWDAENVTMEKLEFMLSDDETAIYAAYNAGDLDFIDTVPPDEIEKLKGNPEFHIIDNLGTYYINFNVKSKLFDGKTVEEAANMRKGISYLIDRPYIVETVGQTGQLVATSFIPAKMLNGAGGVFKDADGWDYPYEDGYFEPERDVEKAVEFLKAAGFKFDDNNVLSPDTPLAFEYVTNQTAGHVAIAEIVQQDLAEVGIAMTIKTLDWNVFLNERKAGNYDVARNGWIADFNDPINMLEMWTSDSGNNDAQLGK
ncbi:MAG: peptide ABC transporter substrate-binding protein [Christensenellaceae bacterium]|nr:peptide ABC transporter substrate-binding protein [Christensenellaceae bacterium]